MNFPNAARRALTARSRRRRREARRYARLGDQMKLIPYWIQRADFSATDYSAVEVDDAVRAFEGHDWRRELGLYSELESARADCCPPGIGFVDIWAGTSSTSAPEWGTIVRSRVPLPPSHGHTQASRISFRCLTRLSKLGRTQPGAAAKCWSLSGSSSKGGTIGWLQALGRRPNLGMRPSRPSAAADTVVSQTASKAMNRFGIPAETEERIRARDTRCVYCGKQFSPEHRARTCQASNISASRPLPSIGRKA